MSKDDDEDDRQDFAVVGELGEAQADLHERLIAAEPGSQCTLYFNSPGGDPYCAISLMNLILHRDLDCTAIVTGECSSAALWPFAACRRRLVAPLSVFLFHSARWESEENIGYREAKQWASHFEVLARETEELLAQMLGLPCSLVEQWIHEGRYVMGPELVERGCAEMLPLPGAPIPVGKAKPSRPSE